MGILTNFELYKYFVGHVRGDRGLFMVISEYAIYIYGFKVLSFSALLRLQYWKAIYLVINGENGKVAKYT